MKSNGFYIGGAQKGTRVRWAKDRRSGKGTVITVHHGTDDGFDEWTVRDDATGDPIRCNINQIRHLNIPNRVKKARYADKHNL